MPKTKQRFIKPSELLKEAKKVLSEYHCDMYCSSVIDALDIKTGNLISYGKKYNVDYLRKSYVFSSRYVSNLLGEFDDLLTWLSSQDIPNFPTILDIYILILTFKRNSKRLAMLGLIG